ncbi:hypothetical protein [Pseudarthrobacter sp. S9]|uniref:hypothetical protein n=1 Tax=Pseudarthrobacter sp. S9 TaxID=3418421 RepID=UPI003CFF4726
MSTALDTDLAALVGEMEAPACEGVMHAVEIAAHGGPAAHYTRLACPECGIKPIKAHCAPFVRWARQSNSMVICPDCKCVSYAPDTIAILGPVNQ